MVNPAAQRPLHGARRRAFTLQRRIRQQFAPGALGKDQDHRAHPLESVVALPKGAALSHDGERRDLGDLPGEIAQDNLIFYGEHG